MGIFDPLRSIDSLKKSLVDEFGYVDGLEGVLDDILELTGSDVYWEYFKAFKMEDGVSGEDFEYSDAEKGNIRVVNLARENLSSPVLYFPPITDLVEFLTFYVMYRVFEDIYYVYKGSSLVHEDFIRLLYGGLDERVMRGLDQFDTLTNPQEVTAEYFLKLKKMNWKDKKVKKLHGKLHELNCDKFIEEHKTVDTKFTATEGAFILFLAACCAVNDDRLEIVEFDLLMAYKTYFKLLNTDITRLM
ncbi:hypothetical protein [Methanobacterium congolense]|uniref:Uncharacterized protein n=1 Tax=Methanobacterium congolense TaxID=118062 RepID=A0A1D3KZF3_9EURY|nr:hypothetical protein [Methanobacterium congolense]SCG84663.1 putative protein [Methanobacterium congolense]